VDELSLLGAAEKQKFLLAAAACVQADGHVTPAEQELFQTFAELLGCPTPALF
jgi:tellurite resistance protein